MLREGGTDIGCHNCKGACCRERILMELTPEEADFLEAGGTQLEVIVHPNEVFEVSQYQGDDRREIARCKIANHFLDPRKDDRGAYKTLTDCGYLQIDPIDQTGQCSMYDDPRRPKTCGQFPVDSKQCNQFRADLGLPARQPETTR